MPYPKLVVNNHHKISHPQPTWHWQLWHTPNLQIHSISLWEYFCPKHYTLWLSRRKDIGHMNLQIYILWMYLKSWATVK